jgi:DNA repair protein RecN (Recombination protein N)
VLRRIALRQFVIVDELDLELVGGFGVLTGETGAGKSILVDALQIALGQRADAGVVREGAARAEVCAEFDVPPSLQPWLDEAGLAAEPGADPALVIRRVVDAQGKSRAWVNGSTATLAQLREMADHLVDIHGQHAWQSLARPAAVRALVDEAAGAPSLDLLQRWQRWQQCQRALDDAETRQADLGRERERLAWQIGELERLGPGPGEWESLNAEHTRRAHAQALIEAAQTGVDRLAEGDSSALVQIARATAALDAVTAHDPSLAEVVDTLQQAEALVQDAAHTLGRYVDAPDLDPDRLQVLDERLGAWMSVARRHRCPPAELPDRLQAWRAELAALDAAADLGALREAVATARHAYDETAREVSRRRREAAPRLARAVTEAMQPLGLQGGRLEIALEPLDEPQAFGLESVEFRVAGHAGSTPRPIGKVASGGELSRIALAIAATLRTGGAGLGGAAPPTVVFDEIDAGIGGTVAHTVGQLMRRLGHDRQVLAVTHLAQVASQAVHHHVVSKHSTPTGTVSRLHPVHGDDRVAEIARMLGSAGTGTGLAHAREMLDAASRAPEPIAAGAVDSPLANGPARGRRRGG